ncbi:MAG: cell wall hydrolase [Parvularculaceae bacterium]
MTGSPVHKRARCAGDRRQSGDLHWPEVSWTVRSLLAGAGVAACIMMTAMSATASVKRSAAERAAAREVADEAQLVTEYAQYLTEQTTRARAVLSTPRLKPAVTPAMIAAEGAPIGDLVDFDFSNIEIARLDEEERTCLAQAIYYEARSESRVGRLAVADVVLNRVSSPVYPDTICEVVFQGSERKTGCQFSFTCDGSMKARLNKRMWSESKCSPARFSPASSAVGTAIYDALSRRLACFAALGRYADADRSYRHAQILSFPEPHDRRREAPSAIIPPVRHGATPCANSRELCPHAEYWRARTKRSRSTVHSCASSFPSGHASRASGLL